MKYLGRISYLGATPSNFRQVHKFEFPILLSDFRTAPNFFSKRSF